MRVKFYKFENPTYSIVASFISIFVWNILH